MNYKRLSNNKVKSHVEIHSFEEVKPLIDQLYNSKNSLCIRAAKALELFAVDPKDKK